MTMTVHIYQRDRSVSTSVNRVFVWVCQEVGLRESQKTERLLTDARWKFAPIRKI